MRTTTLFSAFALAGLFLCANFARADEWNQQLNLTFNNPVEIPGRVLTPGTYVFKVGAGDNSIDSDIVRVYNKNENHLEGLFLTIPDRRLTRADKPVLEFEKAPDGSPDVIYAWFYPGDKTGHEFVYPKSEAMRLARANNHPIASIPDELASESNENTLRQAHVKAEMPSGEEVETIQVFGTPAH